MNPIFRLAFNIAAVLSAVLSVALIWLYTSAKDITFFRWDAGPAGRLVSINYSIEEREGSIELSRVCRASWFSGTQPPLQVVGLSDFLGFGYSDPARSAWKINRFWVWNVLLAMALATVPGIRIARWLHPRKRRHPGFCACGYDLRATPGRCPECGGVPSATDAV